MKIHLIALCAAITIAALPAMSAAGPVRPEEEPPRVIEIRALYQDMVRHRDSGLMVCDRYEHNTGRLVLPGSGAMTYRVTVWRYEERLWQNTQKGAAPKSWLAQVNISRGDGPDESYEFLFDEGSQVVFFYQSVPKSAERRYYFTAEKPVRIVEGKQAVDRPTAEHRYYAEAVIMRNAYEIKRGVMPEIDMR
jgi:hypothetical protein